MHARIVAAGVAGLLASAATPCLAQGKTPAAADAGTLQQR